MARRPSERRTPTKQSEAGGRRGTRLLHLETLEQRSELIDVELAVTIDINFADHFLEVSYWLVFELLHVAEGLLERLGGDAAALCVLRQIVERSLDGLIVFVSLLQLDCRCDELWLQSQATIVVDLLGRVQLLLINRDRVIDIVANLLKTLDELVEAQHAVSVLVQVGEDLREFADGFRTCLMSN